jgi:hypothetical protein
MSRKYIHLDSSYRNRKEYPHPAHFVSKIDSKQFCDKGFPFIDPVCDSAPIFSGNLTNVQNFFTELTLDSGTNDKKVFNYLAGWYLDLGTGNYAKIVSYQRITRVATIETALPSAVIGSTYFIRKSIPSSNGVVQGVNGNYITLEPTESSNKNAFNCHFIRFRATGEVYRITSYDAITKTVFLDGIVILTPPVPGIDEYEICKVSKDNYNGLVCDLYTNQSDSCYEVVLECLTVPSTEIIVTGYNGIVFNYPYLLVSLCNVNKGRNNTMISNNPKSSESLFIAPTFGIDDNQWLTYRSTMAQTMKFNIGDELELKVCLPNGDLLQHRPDNESPKCTEPFIQISAVFGLRKIN